MKKALIVFFSIVGTLFILLLVAPFLFKDKIKAAIDAEIEKNVDAKVYLSPDNLSLSLIRNFPNISVALKDFGVVGNAPFEGDTLLWVKEFRVVLDIVGAIKGEYTVQKILLDNPSIKVIVNKSGKANYDIYKGVADTTQAEKAQEAPSAFNLKIKNWQIKNGNIVYNDSVTPTFARITGLNHSGKGDFTQDVFDLSTQTQIQKLYVNFDSVIYLNNHAFEADLVLNMDMPKQKYTFKDNLIKINDFGLGFDGWVQMNNDSSIAMDVTYGIKQTTFKSLLSLIPAVFTKDFDNLNAEGNFAFNGFAKGKYKNEQLPTFGLNLLVENGMFKYSQLPTAVKNVQMDLAVNNADGIMDNTKVNLKKFHLELGSNPVDATLLLKGLKQMDIDATLKALVNLKEITSIFPVDSIKLDGIFSVDAAAKGKYVSAAQLPAIDVKMNLKQGYIQSLALPNAPLQDVHFDAAVTNATGQMKDLIFDLKDFAALLNGDKMVINLHAHNLDDITYNASFNGKIDFDKITKIFPLDSMVLKGVMMADIATSGKMSLITAGKYDQLPTSGTAEFKDFYFSNSALPQGFKITKGKMSFTPNDIKVSEMVGFVGKSDYSATGVFSNYMGYVFKNETIKGNVNFYSANMDVNEFMTDDPNAAQQPEPTADTLSAPVALPKNIDFFMASKLDRVLFTNLEMTQMAGNVILKDGIFRLERGTFNLLDGQFATNLTYNTQNPANVKLDYDLTIQYMDVQKAYKAFNTVQKLAPAAQNVEGKFSTNFTIKTDVGMGYQPVYETLFGSGVINLSEGKLKSPEFINKVNSLAKFSQPSLQELDLKNTRLTFEIKNGRVFFSPVNLTKGDYETAISGSFGLDQTVDFNIQSLMVTGALGQAASGVMANALGQNVNVGKLNVTLNAKGPQSNPKVSLLGVKPAEGSTPRDAAKQFAGDQLNKAKAEAEAKARAEADRLRQEAEAKARAEAERVQQEAMRKAQEEAAKRGQEEAAKKAREEAEKLKDKIKKPF